MPGLVLGHYLHPGAGRWLLGIVVGLIWGNGFEYCYHRWLLHRPQTSFGRGHIEHHRTVGTAAEPEHVTFGDSPLRVTALFWSNGLPLLLLEHWLKLALAPGIMMGWAIYMIAVEEIHWRVHLGGWLPPGLALARI